MGFVSLIQHRNLSFRLLLLVVICIPVAYANVFHEHFGAYLTGSVVNRTIRGRWDIVLLNLLLFLACLIPLSFRRRVQWTEYGLVTAFFTSLFLEMYGIPFTILLAQKWFYEPTIKHPANVVSFRFLGVQFGMDFPMAYAAVLIIIGALLVTVGWVTLYFGVKRKKLVTDGVYSFSRHPQYLGLIMITGGWLIGWPTILTVVLAPILIFKYIRVAQAEEEEIADLSGYISYKGSVPFLI